MTGSISPETCGHERSRPLPRSAVVGISLLLAIGVGGWQVLGGGATTLDAGDREVTRGTFQDRATIRGEIKALRSLSLTAPSDAGDLRILELAANGSKVRKGDIVIAFDATALKQRFDEKQSDLRASQAEISKAGAEGRLKLEEFTTGRVTAEFDVERAKLDVKAGELQSRFDEQKARLGLSDKEQKLRRQTRCSPAAVRSPRRRSAASRASRTVPGRGRPDVARSAGARDPRAYRWRDGGARELAGRTVRQATGRSRSGRRLGGCADCGTARSGVRAHDRGRRRSGCSRLTSARSDRARRRAERHGTTGAPRLDRHDRQAGLSAGWPPKRGFEVVLDLTRGEARLRPGMSAVARVEVVRHDNQVLGALARAVRPGGRPVAYVVTPRAISRDYVSVAYRNDDVTAVASGLAPGERSRSRRRRMLTSCLPRWGRHE